MKNLEQNASLLRAGAAGVDITPSMGIQISGDIGRYRPVESVNDPIYAKALVLESEGRKLCFLSLDIASMTKKWADRIRCLAAEKIGVNPDAIMVHAVQNHAAPSLGNSLISDKCVLITQELWWLRGGDERYNEFAVERIIEAVNMANQKFEPVQLGAASGIEARVAFNRRFVMRDGTVRTHPSVGDPHIRYAEGPVDPELGVMAVKAKSSKILAMLLYHTCHPVHGYPKRYISAGWPGAWVDGVKSVYGKDIVPLVLNGCCGNIHHKNHLDPSHNDEYRTLGQRLTETTGKVFSGIEYCDHAMLDCKSIHLKIPMRELDSKELEKARNLLKQHPEPIWKDKEHTAVEWDWVYAVAFLDLYEQRKREPRFDYEIQAFRVGDIAFVALGGEPFVESQLRIKLESPTYPTYVIHNCNNYVGYIPTKEALKRGGYETRTANWSKLVPEALDMITDASIDVLKGLFKEKENE